MLNEENVDFKKCASKPCFVAAASALIYGIMVHSFAFFNVLQNHDNIASQPGGFGGGIPLGRWFLEILGRFFEAIGLNYNLSSVNGFAYISLLAITAGILVSTLRINRKRTAALIGALFVAFPTVTATLIYRFTSAFYGISALFAVLAVWVLQRKRFGFICSVVLIALSLGIYQAYVPLTITLMVLLLIQQGLKGESDAKSLVLRGLYDCAALICGLVLYFIGLKISIWVLDVPLTEHQGIATMGNISLLQIPSLVWEALYSVCMIPFREYCGVANREVMRIAYLMLAICSVLMIGIILVKKIKNVGTSVVIILLCAAFLIAVNFIVIMVPGGWIYPLMIYAFALLACAPLVIEECLPVKKHDGKFGPISNLIVTALVAVLVLYYGYYANVNYTALYYAEQQVSNYLSNMVVRVSMTDGYTPEKKWAFIGEIDDPLLNSPWEYEITYGGLGFTEYLMNQYSRNDWIKNYVGYTIPMADEQTLEQLSDSAEIQAMPCYPSAGSIKVMDDTVVIKLQETGE